MITTACCIRESGRDGAADPAATYIINTHVAVSAEKAKAAGLPRVTGGGIRRSQKDPHRSTGII